MHTTATQFKRAMLRFCSLTGAFAVQFSLTKTKTINAPGVRKIAAPSLKALPFLTLTITLSVEASTAGAKDRHFDISYKEL